MPAAANEIIPVIAPLEVKRWPSRFEHVSGTHRFGYFLERDFFFRHSMVASARFAERAVFSGDKIEIHLA